MVAVFRGSRRCTERLFEERDTDPFGATYGFQGGGRPRLGLHHFRKQGQPHRDDFAFLRQPGHGSFQKVLLMHAGFAGILRQDTKSPTKRRQHLLCMTDGEEIDRRGVLAFNEANLQLPHEAGCCHPEIVSHHDDALQSATIALPQGLHQLRILYFLFRMKPLLELVKDDQHFFAAGTPLSSP